MHCPEDIGKNLLKRKRQGVLLRKVYGRRKISENNTVKESDHKNFSVLNSLQK